LVEYVIERSTIEAKWIFDQMLPALPGPGTPAFAKLARELHPYGITPNEVIVDAPSSRMGDVVLSITLLERRVVLRVTAGFFELIVHELIDGDEPKLVNIADVALRAITETQPEVGGLSVRYRIASHLSLAPASVDSFLQDHQVPTALSKGLVTDAIAYNASGVGAFQSKDMRFVITKSLVFDNALFLDANATYSGTSNVADIAVWAESDFETIMGLLGLKERP
jgi:hypothetical protein